MKRAPTLLAAALLCMSHTAFGMTRARAKATTPCAASINGSARALKVPSGTSLVRLHNRRWRRIAIEARIGDDPNPEANRSLGERTLKRGEVWTIKSRGEDVWYRSDADADHPDGHRTPWVHRPCFPNRSDTYDESL
jgi:hypothetical protein